MSNIAIGQPLGPEAIRERMNEIRTKLAEAFGTPPTAGGFKGKLDSAMGGGLSGSIGGYSPLAPFGGGLNIQSTAPADLRSLIEKAASDNHLDPDLLDSLVHQESGYATGARSHVGAMGLTQLMPGTAQSLGVTNPFDPAQNLQGGAKYLKQQIDRFGSVDLGLAAYNAGPGAVTKHGGIPPYRETQNYVNSIMNRYQASKELKGE
jgi:hypothetical protein